MPILAGLVLSLFGAAFAYLARYFTQKLAIAGAAIAAFAAVSAAFFLTLQALIGGVTLAFPQGSGFQVGMYLANADSLVGAIAIGAAADAAMFLYRYQLACIKAVSFVT